jgi:hypothetical protein
LITFSSMFIVLNFTMLLANAAVTTVNSIMILKEVKKSDK